MRDEQLPPTPAEVLRMRADSYRQSIAEHERYAKKHEEDALYHRTQIEILNKAAAELSMAADTLVAA